MLLLCGNASYAPRRLDFLFHTEMKAVRKGWPIRRTGDRLHNVGIPRGFVSLPDLPVDNCLEASQPSPETSAKYVLRFTRSGVRAGECPEHMGLSSLPEAV